MTHHRPAHPTRARWAPTDDNGDPIGWPLFLLQVLAAGAFIGLPLALLLLLAA